MPTESPVSVTLAAAAAPYQKTLSAALLCAGMLRQLINFAPVLDIQEPDQNGKLQQRKAFPSYALAKRLPWGLWSRLPKKLQPRPPITGTVWLADRLVSRWIAPSRIFHGCAAASLASLRAAEQKGSITLVEAAWCHPRHWKNVDREETRHFGVHSKDGAGNMAERLIRRMDQEFATCDRIIVPSAVAQKSFAEYGYGAKTLVVPTGVDADFFSPSPEISPPALFRVCYVGRLEFAKGVGYLLQAWKRLALPRAELLLVGEWKPQMESMLRSHANSTVRFTGFLPPHEVARCYRESHLFVQPSPNEGLAQVLLEAMASGLAVVATDRSGASECITSGTEGFTVPARNLDALADAILWCYRHSAETRAMGRAARTRIERQFTLEHYNRRVLALYRDLAATDLRPRQCSN
jgi:glycosyltransferase involved in cell wall biosynthesis